jgi:hypothetical protein
MVEGSAQNVQNDHTGDLPTSRTCWQTAGRRNCLPPSSSWQRIRCASRRLIWVDSQKSAELGRFSLRPERVTLFVLVELPRKSDANGHALPLAAISTPWSLLQWPSWLA